jgi:hypothetical protein
MAAPHTHGALDNADVGHEESDVNIRAILAFAGGLVLSAIAIHLLIWLLFAFFAAREATRVAPQYPLAAGQTERQPPEPRLQTNPREDLRQLRESEDAILGGYGWVDRDAGVVRIPIDEAMKILVERGLPARQGK